MYSQISPMKSEIMGVLSESISVIIPESLNHLRIVYKKIPMIVTRIFMGILQCINNSRRFSNGILQRLWYVCLNKIKEL